MSIITAAKSAGHTALFTAKKFAPEILTGAGIVGVVTAGVLGAKATLKLEATLQRAEDRLLEVKSRPDHTRNDLIRAYAKNVLELAALYGLPVSLGAASITSILAAHGIMRRRNAALTAAYAVLDKSFRAYRERVAEVLGKEEEQELYDGIRTVTETDANGKKKTSLVKSTPYSPYARLFDEGNIYFQKEPGLNKSRLILTQAHMNDLLQARGYLWLSEVYNALGFEETEASRVVGWRLDSENGDHEVDFHIFDRNNPAKIAFDRGNENAVWLDFNVDGVIADTLPKI